MAIVLPFRGKEPRIHPSAFLAPTAVLIGDVTVGADASVWFGAVIRGDNLEHGIVVGSRTSVQDNCVVHVMCDSWIQSYLRRLEAHGALSMIVSSC